MIARAVNSRLGKLGLLMTGVVLILAIMGPFVAPHDPNVFMGAPFQPSNSKLLLGADVLGRDVLSRVLSGGYRTILLSLLATVMGVAAGALLGMVAGYTKGSTDEIIMRTLDVALAFPQMILALLLLSILGADAWLIVIVVAVIHLPQVARVVRAATLRVTGEDYVLHARVIGMNRRRILLSQVLPNVSGPLLVELGLRFTYSIALISALSFLGLGQQPPTADWGLMINENRIGLGANPWPVLVPVLLIAFLTVGINLLTDAVARAHSAGSGGDNTDQG